MAEYKTNVMRILDKAGIAYTPHQYPHRDGDPIDGGAVAAYLQKAPQTVFKTLVTRGHSGAYLVFVIPVCAELDLKKAARAAGEKSVEMIHVAEINKITGYIRGGCSPVGMKKQYQTVFDQSCLNCETITVSAGKIGYQIELHPTALIELVRGKTADIIAQS